MVLKRFKDPRNKKGAKEEKGVHVFGKSISFYSTYKGIWKVKYSEPGASLLADSKHRTMNVLWYTANIHCGSSKDGKSVNGN